MRPARSVFRRALTAGLAAGVYGALSLGGAEAFVSAQAAPHPVQRNASLDDGLVVSQQVAQALAKDPVLSAVHTRLVLRALRKAPQHILRSYWVYALAQSAVPAAEVQALLSADDPLQAHFFWWRAMRQNVGTPAGKSACARDFSFYAQAYHALSGHLKRDFPLPRVPESTDLQRQLVCVDALNEREQTALARVIDDHHYFWLLPRVLKQVSTPDGLLMQGQNLLLLRKYAQAAQSFEKVIKHPQASGELKKQAVIQAGVAEKSRRRQTQANTWWDWISEQDRQFYPEVLWHRGQWDTLIQHYPDHARVPDILSERLDKAVIAQRRDDIVRWSQQLVTHFPEHEATHQARYWWARTLQKQGQSRRAEALYRLQSEQPLNNYYTQMAQCRLQGQNCYALPSGRLRAQAPDLRVLSREPMIQVLVQQKNYQILEVIAPFVALSPQERDLLMSYAYRHNGHYFRAIRNIWQQQTRDPDVLRLMYPLHYDALQKENARRYQIPQALIAGITWQESMYKSDIRSVSGARGLMQLMPRTAKYIAARAGLPGLSLYQLDQPPINIRLGSYYLQQQVKRTEGNLMKVAASYNGGPNAVSRWTDSFGKIDDDVFVERIPYAETRRYAKQVTLHTRIYSQLYGE